MSYLKTSVRRPLGVALAVLGLMAVAQWGQAQEAKRCGGKDQPSCESLEEIVITGTLIPGAPIAASNPTLIITADDLQNKGFTSVADALQHSAISTGAVQGPQFVNGFTPGAQTLSIFGLSPSYTKFLIDGRPIADYPALYNGTDIIASIDGIPSIILDRVDILPGGQSSIYGSDAIAGVVNINLKKHMSGIEADLRIGATKDGGGTDRRIGVAGGFDKDKFSLVAGLQYEKTDPIWGFQRPLTDQYFAGGSSPQTAERDWLVFGLFGQANGDLYYMQDPASCANIAGQYEGSIALQTRANRGQYCGTFRSGWYTINNGTEAEQGYLHAAYDINDNLKLFADVLLDHDKTLFNPGTSYFGSASDSAGPYYYAYDPQVSPCQQGVGIDCDLINLQHIFSPEEAGNLRAQDNIDTKNSIRATLGLEGRLGSSNWQYGLDMTFTENKLTEATHLAFENAINNFFASIYGPNLGPDPNFGQPTYNINFPQFYQPITPAQYASFTGYANSYSRTEDSLARARVTNSKLFTLPGGSAGLALVLEGGDQGWDYAPDPRYLNGGTYLYTATAGSGHRSRSAATAELRLPFLKNLSLNLSNRYDAYQVAGGTVSKDTYMAGLEYHALPSLLLRARYGTSFKAPTLSDEFQGRSGFFQTVTDYHTCYQAGYTPSTISGCPQAGISVFGTTEGNPSLKPITARNWNFGFEWQPLDAFKLSYDVMSWSIRDEVNQQDSDQLLRTNAACLSGQLPASSPTCVNAIAEVTRDANGLITQIDTPKINVATEALTVGVLAMNYRLAHTSAGAFEFNASYSDLFKHQEVRFAGDTPINLLSSPFYSTEFKTKANVDVTWSVAKYSATLYVESYGRTPNYLAQQDVSGYAQPGAADVGRWTLANLSMRYQLSTAAEVSGNINNLFNRLPPVDASEPGTVNQPFSVFNYSNYGRSYYVGVNYKFGK